MNGIDTKMIALPNLLNQNLCKDQTRDGPPCLHGVQSSIHSRRDQNGTSGP